MASLVELNVSANNLEDLPIGIGLLRRLRTFFADDNFLSNIPIEVCNLNFHYLILDDFQYVNKMVIRKMD